MVWKFVSSQGNFPKFLLFTETRSQFCLWVVPAHQTFLLTIFRCNTSCRKGQKTTENKASSSSYNIGYIIGGIIGGLAFIGGIIGTVIICVKYVLYFKVFITFLMNTTLYFDCRKKLCCTERQSVDLIQF